MNAIVLVFLLVNTALLVLLPRRWAPLPLVLGACLMTVGYRVEVGGASFTVIRMLIAAGTIRIMIRGERPPGGMNGLDLLMVGWAFWALVSSRFHEDPSEGLVFRLGVVYDACGSYFLIRVFCQSLDDVARLIGMLAIALVPVALEMVYEKIAFHNLFSMFGGVPEIPQVREGRIRAFGPFTHPILAGTIGAVSLPLMAGIWKVNQKSAFAGVAACVTMVVAAASSGPLMSAMAAAGALLMWRWRDRIRIFRWLAIWGYIGLDFVMKEPAYYIMARIDLTGGSTGWHRGRLIESSIEHLSEWWLTGTDYTRHWMPTGVSWSPNHADITNHYLHYGVMGGLPLMFLFIGLLLQGFSFVGKMQREASSLSPESQYMVWALGASLFAHAVTCIAVSYFDQSVVFIYVTLGMIGSGYAVLSLAKAREAVAVVETENASVGLGSTGYKARSLR